MRIIVAQVVAVQGMWRGGGGGGGKPGRYCGWSPLGQIKQ